MKAIAWFPFFSVFLVFLFLPTGTFAQKPTPITGPFDGDLSNTKVSVSGTGQTTGHIANIAVTNNNAGPIEIATQTSYIPSSGQYQPYIGVIPGTTVPPGVTTTIPVDGICVDVHLPPVPGGNPMPPLENWIPVGNPVSTVPDITIPDGNANIIPVTPVKPFTPEDIPEIITSPWYKPKPADPGSEIIITWPGTDRPVGGTLVPGDNPELFAPVLVAVYEEVKDATEVIQSGGLFNTPFSQDPAKESQALLQHVVWVYTAALTGEKYEKENFADKVYTQFHDNTGTKVNALPKDQKEKMDEGIDDFWNTFTAVGVEAKVLSQAIGNKQ